MDKIQCLCFEDNRQDRIRLDQYMEVVWSILDKQKLAQLFPGKDLSQVEIEFCDNEHDATRKLLSSAEKYNLFLVDLFENDPNTGKERNVGIPLAAIARGLSTRSGSVLGIIGLTRDSQVLYYLEKDFKRKASLPQPGPNGSFGHAFYSKHELFVKEDNIITPDEVAESLCSILIDASNQAQSLGSVPAREWMDAKINIFVSHSHQDIELANRLVDLLTKALKIDTRTIRCTSVTGYNLSAGDLSTQMLRQNLQDCDVVIGLITTNSLSSAYVLFELGAAWGLGSRLVPIMGPGCELSRVRPPLSDYHFYKWNVRHHWEKLIDDLALWLTVEKESNVPAYSTMIDAIIKMEQTS